jgi:hypothetical protein
MGLVGNHRKGYLDSLAPTAGTENGYSDLC